jgi:glutathione peroxidase
MAACAAAVSSSLPIALSCLRLRAPLCTAARTFLAPAASASSSSAPSSVFGKRLGGSVLGFALGNSASSTAVRGMETVNASAAQVQSGSSIYDFVVKDIGDNDVEMSQYKGKVLLIVNVASACGLTTTNYTELAEIYKKYKGQDFEVLAFPCNQFGGQEPGSNEQIKEFACTRFKAEYPIFNKIDVNGSQEAPLYKYLKAQKGGGLLGDSIKWNFAKFLVDKNGNVVDRYAPTTPPSKIEKDIKKYLSS